MTFYFKPELKIETKNCSFKEITICFLSSQRQLFEQFITEVLLYYFKYYLKTGELHRMLDVTKITIKSTKNPTKFKTLFGTICVPQIQVRAYGADGIPHQVSITRQLLGISPMCQIPEFMKELLGWIGSVSTFRIGHKIVGALTNFKCSLMSVWNSVQFYAEKIELKLSPDGTNEIEGDGTGVPTINSGKRGSELKKVFQRKKDGSLHLVGLAIGRYKELASWSLALKDALLSGLKEYSKIILACDGDKTIINVAKGLSEMVKIQMDKWHVFHQLKYYLWQYGFCKEFKNRIISHFFKISMLSKREIEKLDNRIEHFICLLEPKGYNHSATYLNSVIENFYTHEKEKNTNIYTTKTERSMRTTNQRINVGVWSDNGAKNAIKVRLAYYYNGISPLNWKKNA
jgi:hypothetical protein